jgi:methionyl-tRNA synthetase
MWEGYQALPLNPQTTILLGVLVIWSLVWKGIALWRAARNGHKAFYVIILIVNTVGILEIIYLLTKGKKQSTDMI